MQDYISLIILGVVQGLTEFLPVSSTGHLILARELFGFTGATGLAEDAVLHLATALAVLVYFRADLLRLYNSFVEALHRRVWNKDMTLLSALALGTVPAVIAGVYFESVIETVFRSGIIVAFGLIVGSLVFICAEWAHRRIQEKREITLFGGILVGVFQALALIPGMSRSGMAISGGMFLGLSRVEAARFAFLLSFPVILGAGSVKFFELLQSGDSSVGMPLIVGAFVACVSGMVAIHTLITFLKTYSLIPFVVYRLLLAALIIAVTL